MGTSTRTERFAGSPATRVAVLNRIIEFSLKNSSLVLAFAVCVDSARRLQRSADTR